MTLPAHLFKDLPPRFAQAAEAAIEKILEQPDVLGAVLAGSVAQGLADQYSDLDFYVVISGTQRWRGCWILHQTPVEYFFNPVVFLHNTIQNDVSALHILATSVAILPHPELEKLQSKAREILAKPPQIEDSQLEFDRFNTIESVLETRSVLGKPEYSYILPQALVFILEAVYRKHGWWAVRPKSVLLDFKERAPELSALVDCILADVSPEQQQAALEQLAKVVVEPLEPIFYESSKQTVVT
jgi:hypothetical protein